MENEQRKPGRPRKNPDIVQTNSDVPVTPLPPVESENEKLRDENASLREQVDLAFDRISRLEGISNRQRLRKYDELNDPASLKKIGRVASMDGKDPIIFMEKTGTVWMDDNNMIHDEQVVHVKTYEGKMESFGYIKLQSVCGGNSIPCIVNDWDEYMGKFQRLAAKRHEFQRMTGQSSKHDTIGLLEEIRTLEKSITINVTLSRDYGKTFDGLTLDIPEVVYNAIS